MLNDAVGFKKVYLAAGTTDLRKGIEGLTAIIKFQFNLDPYDKNTLKSIRISGFFILLSTVIMTKGNFMPNSQKS